MAIYWFGRYGITRRIREYVVAGQDGLVGTNHPTATLEYTSSVIRFA
jgi:hypothetical protein